MPHMSSFVVGVILALAGQKVKAVAYNGRLGKKKLEGLYIAYCKGDGGSEVEMLQRILGIKDGASCPPRISRTLVHMFYLPYTTGVAERISTKIMIESMMEMMVRTAPQTLQCVPL